MSRLTLVLVLLAAASQAPIVPRLRAQDVRPEDEIARRSEAYDRAFARGNAADLREFFADDVAIIAAGGTVMSVKQVLADHAEMFTSRPGVTMRHRAQSIEIGPVEWGVASERGTWIEQWRQNGDPVTLEGTYQTMWRRVDGRWVKAGQLLIPIRCEGSYCKS